MVQIEVYANRSVDPTRTPVNGKYCTRVKQRGPGPGGTTGFSGPWIETPL